MHEMLRIPFFVRDPAPVDDDVIAALATEVVWLCRSGELDQLYRVYPCFNSRSLALQKLVKDKRSAHLAQLFPNREVSFVAHCHDEVVSLVLQVMDSKSRPTWAADAAIPMRMRQGLAPDGSPLPDGEDLS